MSGSRNCEHDPRVDNGRVDACHLGYYRYPGQPHDTYLVQFVVTGEIYAMRGIDLLEAIEEQALAAISPSPSARPSQRAQPPVVTPHARLVPRRSKRFQH